MERDEAAKQIQLLQEQLKERERKKERDIRISCEVKLFLETFNPKCDDFFVKYEHKTYAFCDHLLAS